jgi:hypothetical protein
MSENPASRKKRYFGISGFLYGLFLATIGVLATGAGHGTYVLTGAFSSPLGFLGIPAALFGAPILWLVIGLLVEKNNNSSRRKLFLLVMATHYCGIILLLNTENFGDWKYFSRMFQSYPAMMILGFMVYAIGQAIIWFFFVTASNEMETNSSP